MNGFDLGNAAVPVSQILRGGPPRDGIPAIDHPKFLKAGEATFLNGSDLVIGLERGGMARAYPLRIMLWHEIVNDTFGGEALVVTYCPLCGTAMVFEGVVNGKKLGFGVSGLLYQSDVLMYDRQTESLWSQLALRSVSGPLVNQTLNWVPSQVLTWSAWKKKHPNSQVLSMDTGFARDYNYNPYAGYERSQTIWFGVPVFRTEFQNKTWIAGILKDGRAKAYALNSLPANQPVQDEFQGLSLRVTHNPETNETSIENRLTGEPVPFVSSFWFAWQAFYPETDIWNPVHLRLTPELALKLAGERDKMYEIQESSDLKNWKTIQTVQAIKGEAEFSNPAPNGSQRFYRARLTSAKSP